MRVHRESVGDEIFDPGAIQRAHDRLYASHFHRRLHAPGMPITKPYPRVRQILGREGILV